MKNILFYCEQSFNNKCGGLTVQYELCKILDNMGINVRIQAPDKIRNSIFMKYYNYEFNRDETIVIYGETIYGNPLNALHVVRWILAPLGCVASPEICETWGKNDLVYYFNSENKFEKNKELIGKIYKMLTTMYVNPLIQKYNHFSRKGHCHTFRKSDKYRSLSNILTKNSFEITDNHTQEDYINIFNEREIFISYNSLTFLSIMAPMCGCISVVIKVDDVETQLDWIKRTAVAEYAKENNIDKLYGIAYGLEEIKWARDTIHLVEEQWKKIREYFKEKTIMPFLEDLKNIEKLENTVENNYFVNYPNVTPEKVVLFTNARDEDNMNEWVAHHLLLGFDLIYIFDHKSKIPLTDQFKNFNKDKERVFVSRCELDGAIKDVLIREATKISEGMNAEWMLYLDADEFLVINENKTVKEFLSNFQHADSVSCNWLLFGTNYHIKEPSGLIVENYTRSESKLNDHLKTFLRPSQLYCANPHKPDIKNPTKAFHESGINLNDVRPIFKYNRHYIYPIKCTEAKIFIAHYYVQSEETYIKRKLNNPRDDNGGFRDPSKTVSDIIITKDYNIHSEFNEEINTLVKDKYAEKIKEYLKMIETN